MSIRDDWRSLSTFPKVLIIGVPLLAILFWLGNNIGLSQRDDPVHPISSAGGPLHVTSGDAGPPAKTAEKPMGSAADPYAGEKPLVSSFDGSVPVVKDYLRTHLNDYDSSEFLEWSDVTKAGTGAETYWLVMLKLRAKNAAGGYMIRETMYYIQNGHVVKAYGLEGIS